LLPPSSHTYDDQTASIARWALRQATHGYAHGISRLDVLIEAARLALNAPVPVTFGSNGNEYSAAEVLEMLKRGDDPRPKETQ